MPSSPPPPAAPAVNRATLTAAFAVCAEKAARNIVKLADAPKSGAFAADGDYFSFREGFFEIGNWTSSFHTGMALLAYERSRDVSLLRQLNRLGGVYRDKVTRHRAETMHDLGFLYSLYSVPLFRLTGDLGHRETALLAADELAKRFIVRGGYIQAWGRMDERGTDYEALAIIDCMMNLPLLFWAARETGNDFYRDVAIRHADTTLAHFIRPDFSVGHAFRFKPGTGVPLRADNYCGHGVDTQWARGTAWAIYGFALAYRHTRDARYLDASRKIARKFLAQLDDEVVPVWDFRLSPGFQPLRDSSAAAIAVCSLQEVLVHAPGETDLAAAADALLGALCTRYLDATPSCGGVLRDAQVGEGTAPGAALYRARNVYTSWGDYYFMESLARILHGQDTYWS